MALVQTPRIANVKAYGFWTRITIGVDGNYILIKHDKINVNKETIKNMIER